MMSKSCILVFCFYAIVSVSGNEGWVEKYVELGDPWRVDCYTSFKKPITWYFVSALPFYHGYLYHEGRFHSSVVGRYDLIVPDDQLRNTLEVSRADRFHAGSYQCYPVVTRLENVQSFKLIVIENSTINIAFVSNRSLSLDISTSFVGPETQAPPAFTCSFGSGPKPLEGVECDFPKNAFSTCKLKKMFTLHEDIPFRCKIVFGNKNSLHVSSYQEIKAVASSQISYVEEMDSWNISCKTNSDIQMKWIFDDHTGKTKNLVLYMIGITGNKTRYNFTESNKTDYSMAIAQVDRDHAGTYKCTHRSSKHLIEKKIDLVVIVYSLIKMLQLNRRKFMLVMTISYVGPGLETPLFRCHLPSGNTTMEGLRQTVGAEKQVTLLRIFKTYEYPEMCEIRFGDRVWMKKTLRGKIENWESQNEGIKNERSQNERIENKESQNKVKVKERTKPTEYFCENIITVLIFILVGLILGFISAVAYAVKKRIKEINETTQDHVENVVFIRGATRVKRRTKPPQLTK